MSICMIESFRFTSMYLKLISQESGLPDPMQGIHAPRFLQAPLEGATLDIRSRLYPAVT